MMFAALVWSHSAKAEIQLADANGWVVTTDGRANGFVSHIWGDDRPEGLTSLPWVGFNENTNTAGADAEGNLRRTRVRSGYVPSTLALNVRKETEGGTKLSARAEIGMQIANSEPNQVGNPTWMEPRAVYVDVAGVWGSIRAGRDLGLFSRGNLLMNYELGHAYGVGFPCAYEKVFGGSCGHVGFGTLWPDFHAQISYSTPKFGDVFQITAGVFDPRTINYSWIQTPTPRVEGEAVAEYKWKPNWGFKAWGNGAFQQLGIGVDVTDDDTGDKIDRKNYTQSAQGVGGGVIGYLGPAKLGVSGYTGKGMDGFEFLAFNPIFVGQATVSNEERRFRPSSGLLVEGSITIGNLWFMGGFGKAFLKRIDTDVPIETVDQFPLLRGQRGISTGVFYRIDAVVLGIDYFNAHYSFDPKNTLLDDGTTSYVEVAQTIHILNGGMTLEW